MTPCLLHDKMHLPTRYHLESPMYAVCNDDDTRTAVFILATPGTCPTHDEPTLVLTSAGEVLCGGCLGDLDWTVVHADGLPWLPQFVSRLFV